MELWNRHKKTVATLAGTGLFILALLVVIFFLYKRCRAEYNGDYTDTLLWAYTAVKSGHFYDPDYWYAYFLPFSGIPIMMPIVSVFGLTYFSHQLGMTVFVLIFAAGLVSYMRSLDLTYGESFAVSGIVMILMCASQITRMIFYGHVIHYSLAIVFMCIAFSLLKHSSVYDADNKKGRLYTVIMCVFCMLCATNGIATILLFFVPFTFSLVLERYLDKKPISYAKDKRLIINVAYMCGSCVAGFLLKTVLFPSRNYEASITSLLPSDGWVWKQSPFLLEWIKVLTDAAGSDTLMGSFDGIRILCMYVLALTILVIPVFALFSYKKIANRMIRLLILFYHLMFATTMLTYSVSYALVSNWRLAGLVCAALLTSIVYILYMIKEKLYVRWVILAIPVIAVCILISMLTVKQIPSALNANRNDQLIGIYKEHGLTRGYSSFWNSANAVTVLSDNEIQVAPIVFWPDGRYGVRHYQSGPSDYEDVPGVDRYFVAVDAEELSWCEDTLVANCIEKIKYDDGLYILVFDRNVFEDQNPVFSEPYPYDSRSDY